MFAGGTKVWTQSLDSGLFLRASSIDGAGFMYVQGFAMTFEKIQRLSWVSGLL